MVSRIELLRKQMKKFEIDVVLLSPSTDLFYLTGIRERLTERLSCVVITQEDCYFVAPVFELANLPQSIRNSMTCYGWVDGENPFITLTTHLPQGEKHAMICATAPSWIMIGIFPYRPSWHWSTADPILQEMRLHKDEKEYAILKDVQSRSNLALTRLLEHGLCGLTERDVAKLLNELSAIEDLDNMDLPIVASGPNSALPHYHTGSRLIGKGDVVLIDFGGSDHETGYQADTTRTFAVKEIPPDLEEVHSIVKTANQIAFQTAKPGISCMDVDTAARTVIQTAGYGEYFTHRLGHGLGLDIHEHPYISAGNARKIEPGFVFSNEPGIYIPGRFGVRIEDLLFIHPDGAECLTVLPHDLIIID